MKDVWEMNSFDDPDDAGTYSMIEPWEVSLVGWSWVASSEAVRGIEKRDTLPTSGAVTRRELPPADQLMAEGLRSQVVDPSLALSNVVGSFSVAMSGNMTITFLSAS